MIIRTNKRKQFKHSGPCSEEKLCFVCQVHKDGRTMIVCNGMFRESQAQSWLIRPDLVDDEDEIDFTEIYIEGVSDPSQKKEPKQ